METITIKDLIDLGSNGVMIWLVIRLLNRLDAITDRIFDFLRQAEAERRVIARASGMNTADLSEAAHEVRRRINEKEHGHR